MRQLNKSLSSQALALHKALNPNGDIVLDIDSTSHLQYGRKMEGLKFNYSGENCLDSLAVFDQFGLAHHLDVREGATFTANNAPLRNRGTWPSLTEAAARTSSVFTR
ncbi:MAG: hypothetical protein H7318_19010 [Oligoflexus sp.]|nr:hypothetical protein [Oligoflexus sp.]